MAQMRFNEVLREARERKGYDLATVARRLRIRPDILRAIEAGDFAAMPPRGYTRNMVNAYARLLGLNPTEIVNMYLDEAYAVQVQRARDNAPRSGFDMSEADRRGHRQARASMRTTHPSQAGRGGATTARATCTTIARGSRGMITAQNANACSAPTARTVISSAIIQDIHLPDSASPMRAKVVFRADVEA